MKLMLTTKDFHKVRRDQNYFRLFPNLYFWIWFLWSLASYFA